jgi:hypothetical protein
MHQIRYINIPTHCRQQVADTLSVGAAVAVYTDDNKLIIGNLGPGGNGKSPSVKPIENITPGIMG